MGSASDYSTNLQARKSGMRLTARMKMEETLRVIGFAGDVEVFLVGMKDEQSNSASIWIEPGSDSLLASALDGVAARAEELYGLHPQKDVLYSDPFFHDMRHAEFRDESRSAAIVEKLTAALADRRRIVFVSGSVRISDQLVYIACHLDAQSLEAVPALKTTSRDGSKVDKSFLHSAVEEVFLRARRLFLSQDSFHLGETDETIRAAASRFVRTTFGLAGHWFGGTNDILNTISTLPYEGRSGSGRIIIAVSDHENLELRLKFRNTISFNNTEAVRKLIEACGDEAHLLSNGEDVFGIGVVREDYSEDEESIFVVDITGRGSWQLSHAGRPLLMVRDANARLPSKQLDLKYFHEIVGRRLPGADVDTLTSLAVAATRHAHGAMLIISSKAADEAERLYPQATRVFPTHISSDFLVQLTAMDGGILVDPQGRCHALGVILDGTACGGEVAARGSRYNNAIRYVHSSPPPAVVIAYSADGRIDILPKLPYRIERSAVEAAVEAYTRLASPPPGQEGATKAWKRVKSLSFYLTEAQCVRVNQARKSVDDWKLKNGGIILVEDDFTQRAELDDSYWLPE